MIAVLSVPLVRCSQLVSKNARGLSSPSNPRDIGPIDRSETKLNAWTGDQPNRVHEILWKTDLNTRIEVGSAFEKRRLVIVGAGMSGLLTAHSLKTLAPILLEQAPRLGGNSKGESVEGIDYSIGAAYFALPEENSEVAKLFTELGLYGKWQERSVDDPIVFEGKKHASIWHSDSSKKTQRLYSHLKNLYHTGIPEIPFRSESDRQEILRWDQISLLDYLQKQTKGPLPTRLHRFLENYCRSSFGAGVSEISAAAGVNFLSAEFSKIAFFPGGNAAIAERLTETLVEALPENSIRTSATVIRVEKVRDGVEVTYLDSTHTPCRILADVAVLACPKFVVKRILSGMEDERIEAIDSIEYRAYLVANIVLDKNIPRNFYDLFFVGDRSLNATTDVIYGGQSTDGKTTVLTLYKPYAVAGARAELLSLTVSQGVELFKAELQSTIFPYLGLRLSDVKDLRVTRWGHPMPFPKPGMITGKQLAKVREPFQKSIFFVEQDNWCLPAFETCVSEAQYWAPLIRDALTFS